MSIILAGLLVRSGVCRTQKHTQDGLNSHPEERDLRQLAEKGAGGVTQIQASSDIPMSNDINI